MSEQLIHPILLMKTSQKCGHPPGRHYRVSAVDDITVNFKYISDLVHIEGKAG